MSTPRALVRKGKKLTQLRLQKQEEKQKAEEYVYPLDYRRFCISVLCIGLNPMHGILFMLLNDINPPSPSSFYRIQRTFIPLLYELVMERIMYWRSQMEDSSTLCFDGAWSHPRNARQCFVTAIDSNTRKLVDFELVQKAHAGVLANYRGPSNLMESYGLIQIIKRWADNPLVKYYCHDNDGKARNIVETYTNFEEILDKGHSSKSIQQKFTKINSSNGNVLSPFEESLMKFLKFLQSSEFSYEERVAFWLNAVHHFKGDHTFCPPHEEVEIKEKVTKQVESAMYEFLWTTTKFLEQQVNASTQCNESFNALLAKKSKKDTAYGIGWEARAYIAIIIYNDPDCWQKLIWDKLEITPLSPLCQEKFDKIQEAKIKQNTSRKNDEYRRNEVERRKRVKEVKEEPIIDFKLAYKARAEERKKLKAKKLPTLPFFTKTQARQLLDCFHQIHLFDSEIRMDKIKKYVPRVHPVVYINTDFKAAPFL